MARNKKAVKLASIEPQAEWSAKLQQFEDGEFTGDPAAQLVKAFVFSSKAKAATQPPAFSQEVVTHALTEATAAMQKALCRGDHEFFRRIAKALEHFSANTTPVDRLRACLQILAAGLREKKLQMSTVELSAWLDKGKIPFNADTLRRTCNELDFPHRKSKGGRPQGAGNKLR